MLLFLMLVLLILWIYDLTDDCSWVGWFFPFTSHNIKQNKNSCSLMVTGVNTLNRWGDGGIVMLLFLDHFASKQNNLKQADTKLLLQCTRGVEAFPHCRRRRWLSDEATSAAAQNNTGKWNCFTLIRVSHWNTHTNARTLTETMWRDGPVDCGSGSGGGGSGRGNIVILHHLFICNDSS